MGSVTHAPVAGPNDPSKQVSKDVFEQPHNLAGTFPPDSHGHAAGDLPATMATDVEVAAAVTAHEAAGNPHAGYATDVDLSTHEGAADPHAGYQKESEKGAANGYASLGAGGRVPIAQLGSGTPDGTKFLRDDGTLQTPGGGGVTDHGALTGLADDDHPQYATDADLTGHVAAADPHIAYLLKTIADAKGDMLIATAADTWSRRAAGANRQISYADSTATTGHSWGSLGYENVRWNGALGDWRFVSDAAITTGTPNLTSATAAFTAADQGKVISVAGAAAAGAHLHTTILTYVSATAVTLATNAGTTVSAAHAQLGTSDKATVEAAITAAGAGGTIVFPFGTYFMGGGGSNTHLTLANQAFYLMKGATLKLRGNDSAIFEVETVGIKFYGPGAMDANSAVGTTGNGWCLYVGHANANPTSTQDGLTVDGVEFIGARSGAHLINVNTDHTVIRRCFFHDGLGTGISIQERGGAGVPTTVTGISIEYNRFQTLGDNGISFANSDAAHFHKGHNVSWNSFRNMHTSAATGFCLETSQRTYDLRFTNNYVERQTPSLIGLHWAVISGNVWTHDGAGATNAWAFEISGEHLEISLNIIDFTVAGLTTSVGFAMSGGVGVDNNVTYSTNVIVGPAALGQDGIAVGTAQAVTIIGNTFKNFVNGIAARGAAGGWDRGSVESNRFEEVTKSINLQAATPGAGVHIAIIGNTVKNASAASKQFVNLGACDDIAIIGNIIQNVAYAVDNFTGAGATNVIFMGNVYSGLTAVTIGTLGANYIQRGNSPDTDAMEQLPSPRLLTSVGLYAANITTVTAFATNTTYFVYIGKAPAAITTLDIVARVTAAAVTITWAEVGVFKGMPAANGNASLSRVGFTNVAATFNSTGIKKTTVALAGVNGGDDLWLAFGSQATTPFQIRGLLADDIQSGVFQTLAGRISTAAIPVATTIAGATIVPPWTTAKV